ncbi:type IV secretory system conjugative DNA transfer family protein [Streptomyces zhihengii]|uniref:type IV secretory system conjugative DNA transfer family protein n=1 Tax=Streptomyces zhihengii TaxID=1818004 RepID=UPI003452BC71
MDRGREGRQELQGRGSGGLPDGLLLALLGFLLGLSVVVWTGAGLAGLFAHGAWPTGVTYGNSPEALRALVSDPTDLAGAYPATPPGELSGYGLFWGLVIGQVMVLAVLTVFVLGTVARWRAVRADARAERAERAERGERATAGRSRPEDHGQQPASRQPAPAPAPYETAPREQAVSPTGYPAHEPPAGSHAPGPAAPTAPLPAPAATAAAPTGASATEGPHQAPYAPAPVVPGPRIRAAGVLYGDAATRRPAAVQALLDAEGPALVVTSDPSVWAATKDARGKLGPVLVYDPGHLCDTPARLHWAPTQGCEDVGTAAARAAALLAPVRPRALVDAAMADTAETLLRCWLHAAAVDGRPFRQVHRWAQGTGAHEAVRILRTHPKAASGTAGLLESALTAYPERRDVAVELTARAFGALATVHIREACTPNRTDSLALESFAREAGTLYVVGEAIEDPRTRPGAMPLLTALASDVVEHGRRLAARSTDGRLDPPLTLVLDDVAAVAPLPLVPQLMATGQEQGLPTLVLLRSPEQARARWPEPLPSL